MRPVYKLGAIKRRREQIALDAAEKFAAPLRAIAADVLRVHELQCAGQGGEQQSQDLAGEVKPIPNLAAA